MDAAAMQAALAHLVQQPQHDDAALAAAAAVAQATLGVAPLAWSAGAGPAGAALLDHAAVQQALQQSAAPTAAGSGALGGDEDEEDEPAESKSGGGAGARMRRAPWSEAEEERLKELASRFQSGSRVCWRQIATELGTNRTSKQCREHYLNSLRPDMKKGGWTQRDEYIIAREHSRIGSHWSAIAKKLPGRTDNSIKNLYNATMRSKAHQKYESFLWTYVDKIKSGCEPKLAFSMATEIWSKHAQPLLVQEVVHGEPATDTGDGAADALMLLSGKRKNSSASELASAGSLTHPGSGSGLPSFHSGGSLPPGAPPRLIPGLQLPQRSASAVAVPGGGGRGGLLSEEALQALVLQHLQQRSHHSSTGTALGVGSAGTGGGQPMLDMYTSALLQQHQHQHQQQQGDLFMSLALQLLTAGAEGTHASLPQANGGGGTHVNVNGGSVNTVMSDKQPTVEQQVKRMRMDSGPYQPQQQPLQPQLQQQPPQQQQHQAVLDGAGGNNTLGPNENPNPGLTMGISELLALKPSVLQLLTSAPLSSASAPSLHTSLGASPKQQQQQQAHPLHQSVAPGTCGHPPPLQQQPQQGGALSSMGTHHPATTATLAPQDMAVAAVQQQPEGHPPPLHTQPMFAAPKPLAPVPAADAADAALQALIQSLGSSSMQQQPLQHNNASASASQQHPQPQQSSLSVSAPGRPLASVSTTISSPAVAAAPGLLQGGGNAVLMHQLASSGASMLPPGLLSSLLGGLTPDLGPRQSNGSGGGGMPSTHPQQQQQQRGLEVGRQGTQSEMDAAASVAAASVAAAMGAVAPDPTAHTGVHGAGMHGAQLQQPRPLPEAAIPLSVQHMAPYGQELPAEERLVHQPSLQLPSIQQQKHQQRLSAPQHYASLHHMVHGTMEHELDAATQAHRQQMQQQQQQEQARRRQQQMQMLQQQQHQQQMQQQHMFQAAPSLQAPPRCAEQTSRSSGGAGGGGLARDDHSHYHLHQQQHYQLPSGGISLQPGQMSLGDALFSFPSSLEHMHPA